MQDHGVPGLTVAIVQAPYITRSTGFGVSDVERRTLAASNTIFDIGPMKDAFTAVAVMQLVERGAIGLDDPLPGAPSTVRASLLRPADYGLLERLVADASGVTYRQWVKTRQFERLGVRNTFFTEDLPSAPGPINPIEPATGYRDGQPVPARDGAIYSSAFDLSFWDIALAGTFPAIPGSWSSPATATASPRCWRGSPGPTSWSA
jgi:CubicO group peptidase (beta-lactamase class C family)